MELDDSSRQSRKFKALFKIKKDLITDCFLKNIMSINLDKEAQGHWISVLTKMLLLIWYMVSIGSENAAMYSIQTILLQFL